MIYLGLMVSKAKKRVVEHILFRCQFKPAEGLFHLQVITAKTKDVDEYVMPPAQFVRLVDMLQMQLTNWQEGKKHNG